MIFKRRDRASPLRRVREFFYPRKGFWRGFGYISQRMRRLPDSPHRIALGFACGTFASFSPLFTLHFLLAALCAWILRANILAALFGTVVGNPITFPAIASACLWLGRLILRRSEEGSDFNAVMEAFSTGAIALWRSTKSVFGYGQPDLAGLGLFLNDLFLPYALGGVILGTISAFVAYWLLGPLVTAYQIRRQRRFEERARELKAMYDREQAAYAARDRGEGDNV